MNSKGKLEVDDTTYSTQAIHFEGKNYMFSFTKLNTEF